MFSDKYALGVTWNVHLALRLVGPSVRPAIYFKCSPILEICRTIRVPSCILNVHLPLRLVVCPLVLLYLNVHLPLRLVGPSARPAIFQCKPTLETCWAIRAPSYISMYTYPWDFFGPSDRPALFEMYTYPWDLLAIHSPSYIWMYTYPWDFFGPSARPVIFKMCTYPWDLLDHPLAQLYLNVHLPLRFVGPSACPFVF